MTPAASSSPPALPGMPPLPGAGGGAVPPSLPPGTGGDGDGPRIPGEAAMAAAVAQLGRHANVVGSIVVLLAHAAIGTTVWLAPTGQSDEAMAAAAAAHSEDTGGCSSVISPACLGESRPKSSAIPPAKDEQPGSRRCPEPLRRLLRRDHEPPPPALVDLLEAEIVERLGEANGKALPVNAPKREAAPTQNVQQQRIETLDKLVRADNKLDSILKGGDDGEARRSELGKILGTRTGRVDGDGLVNRSGSAYVREVRIAMQKSFVLPGTVPPWLRAELQAKVRITRMTATGQVLEYKIDKRSGNEAFDDTVQALLGGYKAGFRSLPPPPPHVLEEINSRGLIVDLRGG